MDNRTAGGGLGGWVLIGLIVWVIGQLANNERVAEVGFWIMALPICLVLLVLAAFAIVGTLAFIILGIAALVNKFRN